MVKMIIVKLFYLLIMIFATIFYRSLEIVRNYLEKKGKIVIFGHKIFSNQFSENMSYYIYM